jgi:hypothetical protein
VPSRGTAHVENLTHVLAAQSPMPVGPRRQSDLRAHGTNEDPGLARTAPREFHPHGCAAPAGHGGLTSLFALVALNGTRPARFLNRASQVRILPGAPQKSWSERCRAGEESVGRPPEAVWPSTLAI